MSITDNVGVFMGYSIPESTVLPSNLTKEVTNLDRCTSISLQYNHTDKGKVVPVLKQAPRS